MKLLIVSHMYPNAARPVLGVFVREQVKWLAQDHDVTVLSPVPWMPVDVPNTRYQGFRAIPSVRQETFRNASWTVLSPRYPIVPSQYNYVVEWASQTASVWLDRNPWSAAVDVVHAHALLPDGFVGMAIAKRLNKPLVLTWHGFYDYAQPIHWLAQRVIGFASRILYVGSPLLRNIATFTSDLDKFRRLGNGSDGHLRDRAVIPAVLSEFRRGRFAIVSVGFLIERKGHRHVIEAVAALVRDGHRVCYSIVGDGPERATLETLVDELGLRDSVRFIGNLPHDDIWAHYDAADVFVLPSWDEAFGVVYVEALSRGLPVIGCRDEGCADIIESGVNGLLVAAHQTDALTAALRRLIETNGELARMRAAIDPSRYGWARICVQLTTEYRDVVGAS